LTRTVVAVFLGGGSLVACATSPSGVASQTEATSFALSSSKANVTNVSPPATTAPGTTPLRRSTTTTADGSAPSGTADPADTVAPDRLPAACDLLVEADVQEAFGEPVTAGLQTRDECWWSTANDLKTANLSRRTDALDTWRAGYDNDFWQPTDLGDEAYRGIVLDSIVWRVGDVQYEVNVIFSTAGEPDKIIETLARAAAARL